MMISIVSNSSSVGYPPNPRLPHTEGIFDDLLCHFGVQPDRSGEAHADCPFCGKPAKRGQRHFSFSAKGYKCWVCGESGGLGKLVKYLGRDGGLAENSLILPRQQNSSRQPKPNRPPSWSTNVELAARLVSEYTTHSHRYEYWQAYKPLSIETINRWNLGYGKLPGQTTSRLILPIYQNGKVNHLRGRLPANDSRDLSKWIAAKGSPAVLFNVDGIYPNCVVVIVENPIDAILLMQNYPDIVAVAPSNGAGTWKKDWTQSILECKPLVVIVVYDNDLAGQPNQETLKSLRQSWHEAHPGKKLPQPNGPKLVRQLNKVGVPATLWQWPAETPHKADMGWLIGQPNGIEQLTANLLKTIRYYDPHYIMADFRVNLQYISEVDLTSLPSKGAIVVKSPIGTGKTELIKRIENEHTRQRGHSPKILVVSHLQSLAEGAAKRLEYENYKAHTRKFLQMASTLSICINSVPKLASGSNPVPRYDFVVIDEIEQVLTALGGDTFEPSMAVLAKQILEHIIRTANQVILLDAYISPETVNWIKSLRETFVIVNEWRNPEPKPLTCYFTKEEAIAKADEIVSLGDGPVLIATSSKNEARTLYKRYSSLYGQEQVVLVCQDTASQAETHEFLSDINNRLPHIRVLIYTSSMGTGVDITCDVSAVIGIFNRQTLDAEACLQMLGRARNAQALYAFIPQGQGKREVDADELFRQKHDQALRTYHLSHGLLPRLNEAGCWELDEQQVSLLKVISNAKARRNRSLNNLKENFIRLAERQYAVDVQTQAADHPEVKEEMKECRQAIKEQEKQATLKATPVSPKEYEVAIQANRLTDDMRLGYRRWKIEDTYRQAITERLYDEYANGRGRRTLENFIELHQTMPEVAALDREQFKCNTELHRLNHHTPHLLLRSWLLTRLKLFDPKRGFDLQREVTEDEIIEVIEEMQIKFANDIKNYWRPDVSDTPLSIVRRVLREIGLRLETKQSRRGNTYHLDKQRLLTMMELRAWRLAGLAVDQSPK